MALSIGQLTATIDADPSGMIRGLTEAELAAAGFRRTAEGELRRVDGSLVSTGTAARELGTAFLAGASDADLAVHGLARGADGSLRDLSGNLANADEHARRLGDQLLLTSTVGGAAMRHLGDDSDRALGDRGLSGRSRLAGRALTALRGTMAGVGSAAAGLAARMAPLLAGLGSAVPLVAGLVGTLESIVPAATVAVTGILAVVTVTGTLKLAMHGVGDAIKSAFDPGTKPKELQEALKGLAPSAREFVLALRSMQPQLKNLQQNVQGVVFEGLAKQVKTLGATLLPILQVQLYNAGFVLNGMASGAINAASKLGRSGVLGRALDGVTNGLYNLQAVPGQVVTALGQLAAAGAPLFQRLTAAAGDAATGISAKLSKAFSSGGLSDAIDTAVGVLKQLGTVLGNVGSIIGSVFSAAGSAGGSWLGILQDITGAMAKAFASPGVQAALGALFSTMRVVGETVGPLVAQALAQIAPILVALGPPAQTLVRALGTALRPVIKALGPVLLAAAQAVGALVTALSPLLPIVGGLIAQLVPILTPVLSLLTTVFLDLAGPIKQLATALGTALKPVIKGLSTVVQDLVDQYLDVFLDLLGQLTPMIPVLVPVLLQLGQSFGQILAAVAPLIPQLATLYVQFIAQLLPAILPLIPPLAQLTTLLLILATDVIVGVVVPVLGGLVKALGGISSAVATVVGWVLWLVKEVVRLFQWLYDVLVGHSIIPDLIRSIVSWFTGLPGKVLGVLAGFPAALARVMVNATNAMIRATITGLAAIVSWFRDLPGRAKNALGNLGSYLYNSGRALLRGFADGIRSMAGSVASAAGSVLSKAKGFFPNSPAKEGPFSGSGWTYHSGVATARDWAAGLSASRGMVAAAAGGLLGAASGSLGGSFGGASLGGGGLALAGAGTGGGTVRHEVVLSVEGNSADPWTRAIRETVRVKGGGGPNSVQKAFG